jgi:hypothetical protein
MKKAIIFSVLLLIIILPACSGNTDSAFTIHKKELSISIGESKESIDEKLGGGVPGTDGSFSYDNSGLKVSFTDGKATSFAIDNADWSTIRGITVDMAKIDVTKAFAKDVKYITNAILFDKASNVTYRKPNAAVSITYVFTDDKVSAITVEKVV